MDVSVQKPWIKIGVLLSFLVMLTVNALANILPINGIQTGDVANRYQNLFTPAPLTFGIWGVIYLALTVYVVFQLLPSRNSDSARQGMLQKIGKLFIGTSLLNAGWIFAWHYQQIPLTIALMVLLLLGLIRIGWLLRTPHCSPKEELALRIPFGLYFGWITVATIANITVLLVSLRWDGFGLSNTVWTVAVLLAGLAIASATMYRIRSVAYGLAVLWAYAGILIRHLSPEWYGGQYLAIILTVCVSLGVLLCAVIFTAIEMRRKAVCTR